MLNHYFQCIYICPDASDIHVSGRAYEGNFHGGDPFGALKTLNYL